MGTKVIFDGRQHLTICLETGLCLNADPRSQYVPKSKEDREITLRALLRGLDNPLYSNNAPSRHNNSQPIAENVIPLANR